MAVGTAVAGGTVIAGLGAIVAGIVGEVTGNEVDWDGLGKKLENGWNNIKQSYNKMQERRKAEAEKHAQIENPTKVDDVYGYGYNEPEDILGEETENELETFFPENSGNESNQDENKNTTPQIPKPSPGGAIAGALDGMNNTITDETNTNIETQLNFEDYISKLEELQKQSWERENAIRKETQEREDTAYQRAVADMQKAGINPNLMNVQPASSGGGITNVSNMQGQGLTEMLSITSNYLENLINNNFKGDENEKDRLIQGIGTLLMLGMMYMRGK